MQGSRKKAEEWIAGAEAYLQDRYDRIRRDGGNTLAPRFAINPPLDGQESEYFLRGMEEGIFSIDDQGYAQSVTLPPPSGKGTQKKILQLFWNSAGGRYLFREGVCQLATVSALTLKYHWRLDQIEMEPTFPDFPHLAWAVDIVLRSAEGTIAACCEVKRNDRELDQLVAGFRHCCTWGRTVGMSASSQRTIKNTSYVRRSSRAILCLRRRAGKSVSECHTTKGLWQLLKKRESAHPEGSRAGPHRLAAGFIAEDAVIRRAQKPE